MARLPRLLGLRFLTPRLSFTKSLLSMSSRATSPTPLLSPTATYSSLHSSQIRLLSHSPARRSPSPEQDPGPGPNAGLGQRLKHLIKSYGWYATGVYLLLSIADFTVAFVGINLIGAEHVSYAVHIVKDYISSIIYSKPPIPPPESTEPEPVATIGNEGFYAMLLLAYTVHKTIFLPVRIGLTAAVTPKLVNWLRSRGWAGGEGAKRAAREFRERVRRNSHSEV